MKTRGPGPEGRGGAAHPFFEGIRGDDRFQSLLLPGGTLSYSDLQPGEEFSYSRVSKAYRYASAEVVIGPDTARIQVIDYVGETPLKSGRYTYILRVFEGQPLSLSLDFIKDS